MNGTENLSRAGKTATALAGKMWDALSESGEGAATCAFAAMVVLWRLLEDCESPDEENSIGALKRELGLNIGAAEAAGRVLDGREKGARN